MKVLWKVLLVAGLGALGVAGLWGSGILYWRFRIDRAIRSLERDSVLLPPGSMREYESPAPASALLEEAGCRALPYLVAALDPARKPPFLAATTAQIVWTLNRAPAFTKEDCDLRAQRREAFQIDVGEEAAVRERKCAQIKDWWRLHGGEVHQGWRFWSGWCGKPE